MSHSPHRTDPGITSHLSPRPKTSPNQPTCPKSGILTNTTLRSFQRVSTLRAPGSGQAGVKEGMGIQREEVVLRRWSTEANSAD